MRSNEMSRLIIPATVGILSLTVRAAIGSLESIGMNGINSVDLPLTGAGIDIGQVEIGRPGDKDIDTHPLSANLYHTDVNPADVFRRHPDNVTFVANADSGGEVSAHAVQIAGLMISTHATARGVAPDAELFSVAVQPMGTVEEDIYAQTAVSAQHIAALNGQDVRAFNMSLNVGPATANPNGSSTLTEFIDWSAGQNQHDVLYVVAGYEVGGPGPIPSDNFNGITVGASTKNEGV
jgi:hypothetical protein